VSLARHHHTLVGALLLASTVLAPVLTTATPVAADSGTRVIQSSGTAVLVSRPDGPEGGVQNPEFAQRPDDVRADAAQGSAIRLRQGAGPSNGAVGVGGAVVPNDEGGSASSTKLSFNGLNFRQQRLANGGNQFSVEPPDQALCASNSFVVEFVNDVLRVFDTRGNPLTGVVDLNTFYRYPAQFNRTTGRQGPFVTDPSCWFDAPTQRFFHVVLTLEVFPDTGDFTGENHLDLAVSQTSDPTGSWNIYRTEVQDDGQNGTPDHGCPAGAPAKPGHHAPLFANACIGDFPHIGADSNGIYLTTNEYCLFCAGIGFHAAQIYAFNKQALASGAPVAVTQIDTIGLQSGKPGFTLWPATSPTAQDFDPRSGGTEFFTSSNAAEEVSGVRNALGTNASNQIVTWALTNTSSLKTATPALRLRNSTVQVDRYTPPPQSNQKAGNFPLGQCVNDTTSPTIFGTVGCWTALFVKEPPHDEVEGKLDSSDSRVLSTTYARGRLYGTLDTGVTVGGKSKAGVLYYIISPQTEGNRFSAELDRQGHVSVANNNVIYGAIAATHTGRAVIGFTLVGDTHYPSAAYVSLSSDEGRSARSDEDRSPITIAAEGLGPQDGFSEYKAFALDGVHPTPRWGDYGSALATDNNTILIANEYIAQTCTLAQYMSAPFGSCGGTRATLGNWATRITSVDVSEDQHRDR
jgi:hypothetical protein